ncbi:tRNA lysidine(34) synthetase TilS [Candidatus Omnitrophota bacterium]
MRKIKKADIAFLKKVKDSITHYGMIEKGDRVLVAVSGGADSVCLLKSLLSFQKEMGIEVLVANLDHSLRGDASKRDSEFVRRLSEEEGVKFVFKKVNARSGRKGLSTEEKAREKRYAFLLKTAEKEGCRVIATGHTMDDQAETVLMRMMYGSSLSGLTGIPPVREDGKVKIIRPLIRIERKDIESFLERNGYKHVKDASNKDLKFQRNRVRLKVLPYLEKQNPRIKRSLANLSDSLREDLTLLNAKKEKVGSRSGRIKTADIILQPKATRKDIFKELLKAAGGNIKKLTYRHWMDMDRFLKSAQKKKSLDLPGSVRVTKTSDEIVFTRRGK